MLIAFLLALLVLDVASECVYDDKLYHEGEEWTQRKRFVVRCMRTDKGKYEVQIVACHSPVGRIKVGGALSTIHWQYKCARKGTRGASYSAQQFQENQKISVE